MRAVNLLFSIQNRSPYPLSCERDGKGKGMRLQERRIALIFFVTSACNPDGASLRRNPCLMYQKGGSLERRAGVHRSYRCVASTSACRACTSFSKNTFACSLKSAVESVVKNCWHPFFVSLFSISGWRCR